MAAVPKVFRTKEGDEFTFLFSIRGIMAAEDAGAAGMGELVAGAAGGRLGYLASLIYGGLKPHHPNITLEQVWEMMEGPDGVELGKALWPAIDSAMPDPKETEADPPKARKAGTGKPSSPRGAKSA